MAHLHCTEPSIEWSIVQRPRRQNNSNLCSTRGATTATQDVYPCNSMVNKLVTFQPAVRHCSKTMQACGCMMADIWLTDLCQFSPGANFRRNVRRNFRLLQSAALIPCKMNLPHISHRDQESTNFKQTLRRTSTTAISSMTSPPAAYSQTLSHTNCQKGRFQQLSPELCQERLTWGLRYFTALSETTCLRNVPDMISLTTFDWQQIRYVCQNHACGTWQFKVISIKR